MKITVEFDSEAEFEDFKTSGKKTRTSKKNADGSDDTGPVTGGAPAPMQPPAGGAAPMETTTFAPPAGAPQGGFPGAGATSFPSGPAPEIMDLVQKIGARVDSAITAGTTQAEPARKWIADQCGPEAANATLDQLKSTFLVKLSAPVLTNMAKLLGVPGL